ncbi:MAG TPA: BrnT family toxin [Candidatus Tectomicrobia bacterium]
MADARSGRVDLQFEWDDDKAASNLEKHGVSFEEATTVFRDPFALIFDDEAHTIEEQREIIIGHSTRNRLLLVCFTERGARLRIFSARPATRKERQDYERHTNL